MDFLGGIFDSIGGLFGFGDKAGGGGDDDMGGAKAGLFGRASGAKEAINSGRGGGNDVIESLLDDE